MTRRNLCALLTAVVFSTPMLGSAMAQPSEAEIEEAIRIFNRGKSLHQEQRYQDAIREYRAAIKLDDENPFIYNALGLALASVGQLDDALSAFNTALRINPDLTDVYNNMGMAYAEKGQRDKAFEAFGRAVRNPSYPTPEKSLYNLGNLYLEDGNLELAMIHYKRAVEKEPEFSLGYRGLGKVHLLLNEVESAEEEFTKAVEISEDDTESLYQLGRIHQQRGDTAAAMEFYRRVIEADRFSPIGELALQSLDALKSGS